MAVIETRNLRKSYGNFEAVRGLDLDVPKGSITGFLGQNGAGKSSTLKMLMGMMRPTSGFAHIFNLRVDDSRDSLAIRRRTAFVSEDKRLYDYMTVSQIIRFTRSFFPSWREELEREMLEQFRLPLNRPIKKLSKGMRTQTALLLALARGCELLILDEPTEGLDPVATEQVLSLIAARAADGVTVFFSSHQIAEVEQIAERVLVIDKGRLVMNASLDEMRQQYRRIQLVFDNEVPAAVQGWRLAGVQRIIANGRSAMVIASHNTETIAHEARSFGARTVEVAPITLREVFLDLLRAGR